MKKVLFIITSLETGGAEKALLNLVENLDDGMIESKVVVLGEIGGLKKRILDNEIDFCQINFQESVSLSKIISFFRLVLGYKPDVIQGWMYHGSVFAILAKAFYPFARCFIGIRNEKLDEGTLSSSTLKWVGLLKKVSFLADRIIYPSKEAEKSHVFFGYDSEKSEIIANGCDTSKFQTVSNVEKSNLRNKYRIPVDAKVLAYVSRFHPHKDPETFFRSLVQVIEKQTNIVAVCAGMGLNKENTELQELLNGLKINKNVYLLGLVENVQEIYQLSDLQVLSSVGEAFPNVILEGLACGLSCVSTNVGNISKIMGGFGQLVPPKSPDEMADAILKGLKSSTFEDEKHDYVKSSFSIKAMVKTYEKVYF